MTPHTLRPRGKLPTGDLVVRSLVGPSDRDLVACTGELRPLPPLGGAHATVHLPAGLSPGEYRVVHELEVVASAERSRPTPSPWALADEGPGFVPRERFDRLRQVASAGVVAD